MKFQNKKHLSDSGPETFKQSFWKKYTETLKQVSGKSVQQKKIKKTTNEKNQLKKKNNRTNN